MGAHRSKADSIYMPYIFFPFCNAFNRKAVRKLISCSVEVPSAKIRLSFIPRIASIVVQAAL